MTIPVNALAMLAFALLAIGYALLLILGRLPATATTIRSVWPILWVETLIVTVVAGSLWIGGWVLALAIILHCLRITFEAVEVASRRASTLQPMKIATALTLLCILLSYAPLSIVAPLSCVAFLTALALRRVASDITTQTILDLILFPGLPLVLFTIAGLQGHAYCAWLLLAFLMVEVFDSYALLGGKLFGRTKAFPTLSPNKTVEGLASGFAMLILTALVGAAAFDASLSGAVLLAVLVAPVTVAGDLAASRLKRLSHVKDFPKVLPHQGGLLDTTDAWIAVGAAIVIATQAVAG